MTLVYASKKHATSMSGKAAGLDVYQAAVFNFVQNQKAFQVWVFVMPGKDVHFCPLSLLEDFDEIVFIIYKGD